MDVLQCLETGYITLVMSQSCKKGLTSYCMPSIVVLCEWDWFLSYAQHTTLATITQLLFAHTQKKSSLKG